MGSLQRESLESLPREILVHILCYVDHDDLKNLCHVSKLIREATLIAKQWHFSFHTPSSKNSISRKFRDLEILNKLSSPHAPNAPKLLRIRPRMEKEKLQDIRVALFA